jgi:small-conductance mechanosensitive channel
MEHWSAFLDAAMTDATRFFDRLSSTWMLLQLGVILAALAIAYLSSRGISRRIEALADDTRHGSLLRRWRSSILERVTPVTFLLLVWLAMLAFRQITWPSNSYILKLVVNLTAAWIVINALALVIRNRFLYRVVSGGLWLVGAASILGYLPTVTAFLDGAALSMGEARLSALTILQAIALLAVLLWGSGVLARGVDAGLARSKDLTPSLRVLIGKMVHLLLATAAVLFTISAVGIDLTALAVFSGAVGVGVGFGLQKSVSNFVSGITVLLDKSIKPGDVIALGDTFGWITALNARYVSVVTRDGREHLIPNETFVSETVINWSYSDDRVRIEVPFGTSYASDPHAVKRLIEAACAKVKRVLPHPKPVVHFIEMGDSSLNFVARVWIRDPVEGLVNVKSAVLLAVWDALRENGIEIPFPQRDVHLRGPVTVRMEEAAAAPQGV